MIETKVKEINSIYSSINDIRQTVVKNAQDNLSDYTEDSLLSHNRADTISICMLNKRFHIDTSSVRKNRAFIYTLPNPKLKSSDNENELHASSLQFLKDYFDAFTNTDILVFAIEFDGFINKDELNKWLIINYLSCNQQNQYDSYFGNYIAKYHLTEYIIYWLDHFAKLKKIAQDDLQKLNLILEPVTYTSHIKYPLIIATFIDRVANLIFTTYPDYYCDNLVKSIYEQFAHIKYKQLNLPFKYLDDFLELSNHKDGFSTITENNSNEYISTSIPVNFTVLTNTDMNSLMDVAVDLTQYTFRFDEFQSLIKRGVTFDTKRYQSDIESIIRSLENIYQRAHNDSTKTIIKMLTVLSS